MQKEELDIALFFVAVTVFVLLLVMAVILLFRIYLKRKNKLILEKELLSIQFEQTLLQSKLEIQEQTFADISREIHDNIGQVLSLARINLNTLQTPNDTDKRDLVDDLMGKAITDLRNLSHSLDTDLIRNKGWLFPVQKLLADLEKSGKFEITQDLPEVMPALHPDKGIILFRMIQEMVGNIIKHSQASKILFSVKPDPQALLITLTDNGKGFDKASTIAGSGLNNLEGRARMIDASLDMNSEPGHGTTFTVAINTSTHE